LLCISVRCDICQEVVVELVVVVAVYLYGV